MFCESYRPDTEVSIINYIAQYPSSAFLYCGVVMVATLMAYRASLTPNTRAGKTSLLFLVLILTLFSSLRGSSVGTDTAQYLSNIFYVQNTGSIRRLLEPGFEILVLFISFFIKDPQFVLVVIALIINGLIVKRLWMLRSQISFSYAIFIYTTTYYIMTFSGLRQWLAVSIIFFGSKYLFSLNYFKYVVTVIIASLFHNTSIFALILPILDMLSSKLKYRRQKLMFILLFFLGPLLVGGIVILDSRTNLLSQYGGYFLQHRHFVGELSGGLMIWIKIIIGIFVWMSIQKSSLPNSDFRARVFNIYFLGLVVSFPGYYIANLARIGWYFNIFETIMFGLLAKDRSARARVLIIVITTLYILLFILEMVGSGRGHMPYIPFWK